MIPRASLFATVFLFSTALCLNSTIGNGTSPNNNGTKWTIEYFINEDLKDIRSQIKCYALPYGAIGCASHVLTYYCLIVNALGRKPLQPWKPQEYAWLNVAIGTIQLIGAVVSSSLAIARCKGHRDLQLLGVWMILTSIAASVASMLGHGRWMFAKEQPPALGVVNRINLDSEPTSEQKKSPAYWEKELNPHAGPLVTPPQKPKKSRFWHIQATEYVNGGNKKGQIFTWSLIGAVWLAGCAMGATGCVNIARRIFIVVSPVWKITVGFFAAPVVVAVFWACSCLTANTRKEFKESWGFFKFATKVGLFFLVMMLFYMDWLLAAVTSNWSGLPSDLEKDGQILYWVYFAIKRLAFFAS